MPSRVNGGLQAAEARRFALWQAIAQNGKRWVQRRGVYDPWMEAPVPAALGVLGRPKKVLGAGSPRNAGAGLHREAVGCREAMRGAVCKGVDDHTNIEKAAHA